jgi:hypothetical protein
MATLDDVLKVGPVVGMGLVALALPFFVPALRTQFAAVLKSGAKLFLEAELGADDVLTDRLVDAAVDALVQIPAHGTEEQRKENAESEVNRFVSAARAAAQRRGWDERDVERRYHRHLAKLEHTLSRARHRIHPSLAHASESLARHRAKAKHPTAPTGLEHENLHSQPVRLAGREHSNA